MSRQIIAELGGGKGETLREVSPSVPLNRGLCGPQTRCGRFGEEIILLPLLGFEIRFLRRPVRWLGERSEG